MPVPGIGRAMGASEIVIDRNSVVSFLFLEVIFVCVFKSMLT